MAKSTRVIKRAANVAALYELDRLGYLEGLTLQEIADALDVGHRATAMRYMRDVDVLRDMVPDIKTKLRHAPPFKPDK